MGYIYFDVSAVIILALLIFTTVYRGLTKGRLNRCFLEMIIIALAASVSDVFCVYLDYIKCDIMFLRYFSHFCYLFFHNIGTPLYVIYIFIINDIDYKMKSYMTVLFSLPIIVEFVMLAINPLTNWVFYIDDTGAYTRGPAFILLYIVTIFYVLIIIVSLIRYGRHMGMRKTLSLACILPFLFIAMVLQLLFPKFLLEMFATSISMLLIANLIQRPEDILDIESGMNNKNSFVETVSRCIRNGKPTKLIVIKITNYLSLTYLIGYNDIPKVLHKLSSSILFSPVFRKNIAESFYLGDGKFCFMMDYRCLDTTDTMARQILDIYQQPISFKNMDIHLNVLSCTIDCPEDIPDSTSIMNFIEKLKETDNKGEVIKAGELFQRRDYDIMNNIDAIIENALANHKLMVYYQPIFSTKYKKFISAEALIRLVDDNYGFISPEFFIPAAEKSGAIHRIGTFVIEEVCKFISSDDFKETGLDYIEVNLSTTQCMKENLGTDIVNILSQYNVKPHQINLELTETAATISQRTMMENINTMFDAGISFSLDDYGTGYSNISRIASIPFKIIKLDKTFVNDNSSATKSTILFHTVSMIKDLGLEIVVEGIETSDMLHKFSALGCHHIQGYYFSRPLPLSDFVKFVTCYDVTKA